MSTSVENRPPVCPGGVGGAIPPGRPLDLMFKLVVGRACSGPSASINLHSHYDWMPKILCLRSHNLGSTDLGVSGLVSDGKG